jgi:hypothetical protein
MPDSQNPSSPNYVPGVGRLVTDRFDFQAHVNGTNFRHNATMIDLSPDLVINSQLCTTVQQALQGLAGVLVAPVIPQATIGTATSNLGIITLGGDLAASSSTALRPIVGGIQGRPIATTPPTSGQVLGWNGSAWGPVASGAFMAGGDLAGTPTSQQVIGLTGTAGTVRVSANALQFISTAVPYISQAYLTTGTAANTVIKAQGFSSGTGSGGNLVLAGGANSGSSLLGGVALSAGGDPAVDTSTGQYVFQVDQVSSNQLVAAFFPPATGLTTTQMPTNSGNKVIYVGNVGTAPITQSSSGVILWSASGRLHAMQSDGVSFALQAEMGGDTSGNYPNPTVSGIQTVPVSSTAPTAGQVLQYNGSDWAPSNAGFGKAYFGDGSDGSANFDGTHTVVLNGTSFAPNAEQVYTLTRNIVCTNMTIGASATVETGGYIIMCTGTLTLDGYIDNSGSPAGSPSTGAGAGAPWGTLGGGTTGGSGLSSSGSQNGLNLATDTAVAGPPSFSQANVGLGAAGGNSANNAGTLNNPLAGFTYSALNLVLTDWLSSSRVLCAAPTGTTGPALAIAYFAGGTGGGGGGSAVSGKSGGGGGGGAGIIVIAANTLTGVGFVTANGGFGGSVSGSSFNSGGGGGGGGVIIIIYGSNTVPVVNFQTNGGAGGTATGGAAGSAGNPGGTGTVVLCPG